MDLILDENQHFLIVFQPTFSNTLDANENQIEIDYGYLPTKVQFEVIEYFKSPEFIQEHIRNYVLNDFTHRPDSIESKYKGHLYSIDFKLVEKKLYVFLYCKLILIPFQVKVKNNYPLTSSRLIELIKDGLHKSSHSGPLIVKWGNYLGDMNINNQNRYMIYIDYRRVWVKLI